MTETCTCPATWGLLRRKKIVKERGWTRGRENNNRKWVHALSPLSMNCNLDSTKYSACCQPGRRRPSDAAIVKPMTLLLRSFPRIRHNCFVQLAGDRKHNIQRALKVFERQSVSIQVIGMWPTSNWTCICHTNAVVYWLRLGPWKRITWVSLIHFSIWTRFNAHCQSLSSYGMSPNLQWEQTAHPDWRSSCLCGG